MTRKMMLAAVVAVGVMFAMGGSVQAGHGHHGHGHHGHGHRGHGHYGHNHRHGYGYGPRYGVVVAPRVVAPPVYPYPAYGYPAYSYPPVYSPYNQALGVQTGNFSLFLGR